MRRNFGFIGGGFKEANLDVSYGIADLHDNRYWQKQTLWPKVKTVDSLSVSSNTVTEAEHTQITISGTTTGFANNDLIYYKFVTVDGATPIDIGTSTKGTVAVDINGNFTLHLGTNADNDSHFRGDQINIEIWNANWVSYIGPSTSVTVNDTSGINQFHATSLSGSNALSNVKDKSYQTHTFPTYGHPSGSQIAVGGFNWQDFGDDIFDNWGFWHFWHPTHGVAEINQTTKGEYAYNSNFEDDTNVSVSASSWTNWVTEGSDGTINTVYFVADFNSGTDINSSLRKHVKMQYGYWKQGIYAMLITFADYTWPFRFVMGGNMGSDSQTVNSNQSGTYTSSNGINFTLYGNYNYQNNSSTEIFSTYFINRLESQNASINRGISGDNLYLWTNEIKGGVDCYFCKGAWSTFAQGIASSTTRTVQAINMF
tara:strand:- start:544 stop:1821 length:1278 start_codon:yes stop_codon:yes gene_type:complete